MILIYKIFKYIYILVYHNIDCPKIVDHILSAVPSLCIYMYCIILMYAFQCPDHSYSKVFSHLIFMNYNSYM